MQHSIWPPCYTTQDQSTFLNQKRLFFMSPSSVFVMAESLKLGLKALSSLPEALENLRHHKQKSRHLDVHSIGCFQKQMTWIHTSICHQTRNLMLTTCFETLMLRNGWDILANLKRSLIRHMCKCTTGSFLCSRKDVATGLLTTDKLFFKSTTISDYIRH